MLSLARTDKRFQHSHQLGLVGPSHIVLPYANHFPPVPAESSRDQHIAYLIGVQLLPPKRSVGCRQSTMNRATVPETPIDEDSDPDTTKDKIGLAKQTIVPPPPVNVVLAEESDQSHLGSLVPS
jgi:hypothetical protein